MKKERSVRVGVFDSGIGGLTVLGACVRALPDALYYYYGDNARAPYGSRTVEEIAAYVAEALDAFSKIGVDAAVLACNTATAVCAEVMRERYPFPIIGTEPAVKPASLGCRRALVLATPRTIESERLARLVAKYKGDCAFTLCALPQLARCIERRLLYGEEFRLEAQLPTGNYDGVVLGCTHYIYFKKEIAEFYGAPVYDGNSGVAKRLCEAVRSQKLEKIGTNNHQCPQIKVKQMYGKSALKGKNGVVFLGKSGKLNELVYKTNICFIKN